MVWVADLLLNEAAGHIRSMLVHGMAAMKETLDRLAEQKRTRDQPEDATQMA